MSKFFMLIMATCFAMYGAAQTTFNVPFTMDFENPNVSSDWVVHSSEPTNQWVVGSATGNPGKSLYVSNDGGTSNAYGGTATTYATAYITANFNSFAEHVI
jgi:hypothetical protein